MKLGMVGHFRIEKREVGTDKVTAVREFDNLITNRGLDAYGIQTRTLQFCYIGRGTGSPSPDDRTLGQYVACAGISGHTTTSGSAPDYVSSCRTSYRFNAGVLTGNFTEVGIGNVGYNPQNDYLFSRALILNDRGEPSSITVQSNEYLDVYYTIYFHPPLQQTVEFDITLLTSSYRVTGKIAYAQSSQIRADNAYLLVQSGYVTGVYTNCSALGDITGTVNGVETDTSSGGYPYHPAGTLLPYTEGSYKRASTFNFGLQNDNYSNGISGLQVFTGVASPSYSSINMYAQYLINPPIPKTAEREMTLTFEWSWGRYGE